MVINQRRWLSLSCLGLKLRLRLGLSLVKPSKEIGTCLDVLKPKRKSTEVDGSKGVQIHETLYFTPEKSL